MIQCHRSKVWDWKVTISLVLTLCSFSIPTHSFAWDRPVAPTALIVGASLAVPFIPQTRDGTHWSLPLDAQIQKAVSAEGDSAAAEVDRATRSQAQARVFSDITLGISMGIPVTQWALSGSAPSETRLDPSERDWLLYSGLHSFGFTWIVTEGLKRTVGRKRPSYTECNFATAVDCVPQVPSDDEFKSFPSGHTSFAFTGAALTCVQLQNATSHPLPLSSSWLCPISLATAGVTAYMRLRGNAHWFTDILAGASIGLISGLLVGPALAGAYPSEANTSYGASPTLGPRITAGHAMAPPLFFTQMSF